MCNNMDGFQGYYAYVSQTEKDKYCMLFLTCECKKTSDYNSKKQTCRYRELRVVTSGERGTTGVED